MSTDDERRTNFSDDESDAGEMYFPELPTIETFIPKAPCYEKANTVRYALICQRLDVLYRQTMKKTNSKGPTKKERLQYLLPDKLKKYIGEGSPYPLFRLILPGHDSCRPNTGLKEATICTVWSRALRLSDNSPHFKAIHNYRNSNHVPNPRSVGVLSDVVADVIQTLQQAENKVVQASDMTVLDFNEWLDCLNIVKNRFDMQTNDTLIGKSKWRQNLDKLTISSSNKIEKYVSLVSALLTKKLSPLEHKYVIRTLLQDMKVGVGLSEVLNHYSPLAMDLWHSLNNLKELCALLSDQGYVRLLQAAKEKNARLVMESYKSDWMPPNPHSVVLSRMISPMRGGRTSFETFLYEVAQRHHQLDKILPKQSKAKGCLAITHPPFCAEVKMDGERHLVHVNRGIVTIQTKNNVWYSDIYSPALGPSIREALGTYDVDVILDGEVLAWDGDEDKPLAFGSNRTVAEWHRLKRIRDGTIDKRDLDLKHQDYNCMTKAKSKGIREREGSLVDIDTHNHDRYWLSYCVWDVLYVGGPDAKKVLRKAKHLFAEDDTIPTGSLIDLSLMQRKCILHNLITVRPKVIEHVRGVVIRPDGSVEDDPSTYYLGSTGKQEYGTVPAVLDSISLAIVCSSCSSTTTRFDKQRKAGRTDDQIEKLRAIALDDMYEQVVMTSMQEGLMLKDLMSPYYLGEKGRRIKYWWKIKPDYDSSGKAADIDLVVVGGRYTDGSERKGSLSELVLACVDDSPPAISQLPKDKSHDVRTSYMVFTKVALNRKLHFNSIDHILETTGFIARDEHTDEQLGKWFRSKEVPSFISSRTFQKGGAYSGWTMENKDIPDIWIRPEDCFVVTLNSAEFISSKAMQSGFTLRFPRVDRYRSVALGDPKTHSECESYRELRLLYDEQEAAKKERVTFGTQDSVATSRFLTAKELAQSGKLDNLRSSGKRQVNLHSIPSQSEINATSNLLKGYYFCVLPGNYSLSDELDIAEAKQTGWFGLAHKVSSRLDVVKFIQSHGGVVQLTANASSDYIIGGQSSDAKVVALAALIASSKSTDAIGGRGILRWTVAYALIFKAQQLVDDSSCFIKTIRIHFPELLLTMRSSDYLTMPTTSAAVFKETEDSYGVPIHSECSPSEFVRGLNTIGGHKGGKTSSPWYSLAEDFDERHRWMFSMEKQTLWPYASSATAHLPSDQNYCVFYPDFFDTLGLEDESEVKRTLLKDSTRRRWDSVDDSCEIASSVPLVRAMGALVSCHLHNGITHILCELKGRKCLRWSPRIAPQKVFVDPVRGAMIQERVLSIADTASMMKTPFQILLVTPDWVEEQWVN